MENPNAWIAEHINRAIPNDEKWTPSEVATRLVANLRANHPTEFGEWMNLKAVDFVHQAINDRHRSERARLLHASKRSVFGSAAEQYQSGDGDALDPYLIPYVIDESTGERAHLGEMTGRDCLRAAEPFRRREAENAMQAAFLEAVGRKADRKKIKNVYSRRQLVSMFTSLGLEVAA